MWFREAPTGNVTHPLSLTQVRSPSLPVLGLGSVLVQSPLLNGRVPIAKGREQSFSEGLSTGKRATSAPARHFGRAHKQQQAEMETGTHLLTTDESRSRGGSLRLRVGGRAGWEGVGHDARIERQGDRISLRSDSKQGTILADAPLSSEIEPFLGRLRGEEVGVSKAVCLVWGRPQPLSSLRTCRPPFPPIPFPQTLQTTKLAHKGLTSPSPSAAGSQAGRSAAWGCRSAKPVHSAISSAHLP